MSVHNTDCLYFTDVAQSTKETNETEYLTNLTRRKTEITVMKKALGETNTARWP